jgi:malate dehydrogenase (oxaloacetate-decarboxylating)
MATGRSTFRQQYRCRRCLQAVAALSDGTAGTSLLPPVTNLRMVSAAVALAVAGAGTKEGLAQAALDDPVQQVNQAMWRLQYPSFEAI